MTRILKVETGLEPEVVAALRDVLETGGVAGIPTDTLYGLAAKPTSTQGVAAIFELKGRDAGKALPVLIGSMSDLEPLGVEISERQKAFLERYWPGALTAVLTLRHPIPASGGEPTLAVRLPGAAWLRALLSRTGPVTATSANRSGAPPARSAEEVVSSLGTSIPLVLDGGPSPETRASTLLDLTSGSALILREGPIFADISLF